MNHRGRLALPLLAWFLIYGRDGDWRPIDELNSETTCLHLRAQAVDNDIRSEIGSALADQPADNPLRRDAFRRAERRVGARYRCLWRAH